MMENAINRHKEKMNAIQEQIKSATGYRKKDLIRQWRKMNSELQECMFHLKGGD